MCRQLQNITDPDDGKLYIWVLHAYANKTRLHCKFILHILIVVRCFFFFFFSYFSSFPTRQSIFKWIHTQLNAKEVNKRAVCKHFQVARLFIVFLSQSLSRIRFLFRCECDFRHSILGLSSCKMLHVIMQDNAIVCI